MEGKVLDLSCVSPERLRMKYVAEEEKIGEEEKIVEEEKKKSEHISNEVQLSQPWLQTGSFFSGSSLERKRYTATKSNICLGEIGGKVEES